ncbi:hypothetical protein GMST_42950 [Geomonas silvestris]|uniref:Uncharacterized protein n=1 Tax=Geomonas silvestris TaxID=2740184 RepID=A0A6V8MPL8_9BACT|nr:hypothetical protein [Geomonas silvestris]GFO61970.1 hypothetical protein GMST_42950 [Geomonas silvestris]
MVENMRPLGMEQWYFRHVEVTSKSFHSGIDGTRKIEKFNCIVAFPSTKHHTETIRNYLNWYHSINTDTNDYHVLSLLSDTSWCAEALAVFYFREQENKPYLEAATDPYKVVLGPMPNSPKLANEIMAIWVNAEETVRLQTERSVAIYLRDTIRQGNKISVETASRLINEHFGSQYRLDSNVLHEFSRLGGKYTKKYLRL